MSKVETMTDNGLRTWCFAEPPQIMTAMASAGLLMSGQRAFGQAPKRIIVPEGEFTPLPIAIPNFVAGTPADPRSRRRVAGHHQQPQAQRAVRAIDRPPSSKRSSTSMPRPNFQNWKTINAQGLVDRRMTRQPTAACSRIRLWDVNTAQQLTGHQYLTSPEYWRRIAHIISDQIYERLTGEKGYFDSRVVFVDETGSQGAPRQAAGHHGSGRRQRPLSDQGRRPGADAAVSPPTTGKSQESSQGPIDASICCEHR